MRTMGRVRLMRVMGQRFVRELDIGRKAQIAPFARLIVSLGPQSSDATVGDGGSPKPNRFGGGCRTLGGLRSRTR